MATHLGNRELLETAENPAYLTEQLITYLGNKRALLDFIGQGVEYVRRRLNKKKLDAFDVFSGSGVVSRYLKQYSRYLITNDLEKYAAIINECYLTNAADFDDQEFRSIHQNVTNQLRATDLRSGLIANLYAPKTDTNIRSGERVFYTTRNARYLDTARQLIATIPEPYQKYLLAPLLSQASVHANTAGVFKGFYKNRDTGIGQLGGKNRDALSRITGDIQLPYPIFSNYSCDYQVLNGDANVVCQSLPEVDLAYVDPPYNQHPYGSNYFMLNLLIDYQTPAELSTVSGIPANWNRSLYNKGRFSLATMANLVEGLKAKYVLISFNSEGFIEPEQMTRLKGYGKIKVFETDYNTFRASRNLFARQIRLKEYLYLLEKD